MPSGAIEVFKSSNSCARISRERQRRQNAAKGYSVVVDLDRDPITRKRRQRWHSGYRTKREAERALSEIISSVHAGSYIEPTKQTLREFTSEWLAAIEPTIRPATHYSYSRNLRLHVSRVAARCCYAVSMGAC